MNSRTYKRAIVTTIVGLCIAGAVPSTKYMHNAWGDDRYVGHLQDLRDQIQAIDNALFEIDQEISFATDNTARSKWTARKNYYQRQKDALKERLQNQDDD